MADPVLIRGFLVKPAPDQKGGTVHGLNPLNRGIRIGSLGIIIINNPVLCCYIFDSVLYWLKISNSIPYNFYWETVSTTFSIGTPACSAMAAATIIFS